MVTVALLATLQAKPEKVTDVSDMLKGAVELAQAEEQTVSWYALQMGETSGSGPRSSSEWSDCCNLNGSR
jgi:quinol monooxygenase YgiN